MSLKPDTALQNRFKSWGNYFIAFALLIAVLVLLGWQFDIEFLKKLLPNLVAMNPATAVGFIFTGISFFLLTLKPGSKQKSTIGYIIAGIVLFIGAAKFSEIFFDFDSAIDHILFAEKLQNELTGGFSNRIAPNTAFNFILTGIALFFLNFETSKKRMPAHYISLIIAIVGLLSVLGYMYRVQAFYGVLTYIPMAFHTAVCFICISLAILFANPDKGVMREFTGVFLGSITARILVPAAIAVPAILGFLRLLGHWTGLFTTEFGVAILVLSIIIAFLFLIRYNTVLLNRRDGERYAAEEKLAQLNTALEQKVAERTEEVIKREKQFFNVVNNMLEGMQIIGFDWRYIYVNDAMARHGKYSKEDLIGYTVMEKYPGIEQTEIFKVYQRCFNERVAIHLENEFLFPDNTKGWFDLTFQPVPEGLFILSSDITEKKRAEERILKLNEELEQKVRDRTAELLEQTNKLQMLIQSSPDAIMVTDLTLKITGWNKAAEQMYGYKEEEVKGKTALQTLKVEHVDGRSRETVIQKLKETGKFEGEVIQYDKNGNRFYTLTSTSVILNEKGEQNGFITTSRDITERKKSQEKIEALNKELEAFTYSVSHDLRAPLRAINGYSKMIEEDYLDKLDPEGMRLFNTVQKNAQKMGNLIDDLLAFSRLGKQEIERSTLDMNVLANTIFAEVQKNEPNSTCIAKINVLSPAKGDYALMQQVLVNLISNAVKYSRKSAHPMIEIGCETKDDECIYYVKDNGVGFDMQYSNKLFGVFQRLHKPTEFEGTGVGLAIVQRIIAKHGGRVWAEAEVNKGATFYFSLPN